jgi:hypothetical protein
MREWVWGVGQGEEMGGLGHVDDGEEGTSARLVTSFSVIAGCVHIFT